MANRTVVVPDLGGAETVDVIELSLAVGDSIDIEGSLVVLESDKATMDVPSPVAGELVSYLVAEGDSVKVGDPIAEVAVSTGSESEAEPAEEAPKEDVTTLSAPAAVTEAEQPAPEVKSDHAMPNPVIDSAEAVPSALDTDVYAGPAVRLLARELGVTLSEIDGSGPRGRIIKDDVNNFVKHRMAQGSTGQTAVSGAGIPVVPAVDFAQFGPVETVTMTKIQKVTAANMHRNWLNVPHVTQFDDADITDLEVFRKNLKAEAERRGIKISPVAFIIKAIAIALQENPVFNRSLLPGGESLVQKHYVNIGMAVDTERGLMVPVLRNVDNMGIWDIAAAVGDFAAKARAGKLMPADMQGGCFTLSSLGAIGGNGFTPIVNAPEAGILGVSKSQMKPVWDGDEFQPRLMLPMALSYDHRLINGGDAGKFLTQIVRLLSDIRHLAL